MMKKLLLIILMLSTISCSKKEDQPSPVPEVNQSGLTKSQLETIFPVTDAYLDDGRLYFVLQRNETQFMGLNNPKNSYGFQYYEYHVEFTTRTSGSDLFVTIKGVEWKVRIKPQ